MERNNVDELLEFNKNFVREEKYKGFSAGKFPKKKIAIIACMDTRLVRLLPESLGIKDGDVKMIKNAGGIVRDPYGSEIRSLLVAILELGVTDIMVIGHTECGAGKISGDEMRSRLLDKGIDIDNVDLPDGLDFSEWMRGFSSGCDSVRESVRIIESHPLIPDGIRGRGFIIDTETAELTPVD